MFNLEAEAEILGQVLFDNSLVDSIAEILKPSDFYEPLHGRIYSLVVDEFSAGRAATPVTLKPYLEADQDLAKVGGIVYLMQLTANQSFHYGKETAKQIAELAKRRRMAEGLQEAAALCADMETSEGASVSLADSAISEKPADTIHQPTGVEAFDEMFAGFNETGGGVKSGQIGPLDEILGPLRAKQLVILAARPGMGKTAVALSYAAGALQGGYGVLFVSLEMSSRELAQRMAADMCFDRGPVYYSSIRDGKLSRADMDKVFQARETVKELPFQIVDAGSLTTGRLSSLIRRHSRKMAAQGHSLDLVIVDYLQLLSPDIRSRSNYENVSEVSRALKAMAKDQNVPIMALAQLSREVEKRPDRRPQLSDLRDSGQIEQDADAVVFLLRDEYYLRKEELPVTDPKRSVWESELEACRNKIEFIVAKRRNGVEGSAHGSFFGAYQAVRGEN